MTLTLESVGIGDGPGAPLPPVSADASSHTPGVVAVETEAAPTLASLIAGGRMAPETGRVLIDGVDDAALIRASFALVDTPTVAEPFADLRVEQVVREELVLAGERGSRGNARILLDEIGLGEHAATRIKALPAEARVRLLCELALLRPGVTGLILTSPERHGGDTARWFDVVLGLADRGITVLIVAGVAAAERVRSLAEARALDPITDPAPAHAAIPDPAPAHAATTAPVVPSLPTTPSPEGDSL